jgi:hypothetical protein
MTNPERDRFFVKWSMRKDGWHEKAMPKVEWRPVERERARDLEHEAGTRGAAKNHPRMDVASEGHATERRAGQALR